MKKNSQIKELSREELGEEIAVELEALKKLKFNHAIAPLESPSQIKNKRRYVAKLKTAMNNREA